MPKGMGYSKKGKRSSMTNSNQMPNSGMVKKSGVSKSNPKNAQQMVMGGGKSSGVKNKGY